MMEEDYHPQIAIAKSPVVPILLLEEEVKRTPPRWMRFYVPVSLALYVMLMLYSVFFLIYSGIKLSDPLMLIQYEPVYQFLEYNSYSLLSPFVCFIAFPAMMYITRKKKKMEDGECFGIIGGMLLLGLVSSYDATGVLQLYFNRKHYLEGLDHNETEVYNPTESNELAWQYAWSTKPSCARIHAIRQREKERHDREGNRGKRVEKEGPPTMKIKEPFENYAWFYQNLTKKEIHEAKFSSVVAFGATIDRSTSSGRLYEEECKSTPDSKYPVSIREWMGSMHKRLKCCGPRGYNEFKTKIFLGNLTSCKEKNRKKTIIYHKGCGLPFNRYLVDVMYKIMICLYLEGACYLVGAILTCFHFAAMKYDASGVVKEYSLLDLDDKGKGGRSIFLGRSKKGKAKGFDPVESLFFEANKRAESKRNSTAEFHLPAALTTAHDIQTKRNKMIRESQDVKPDVFKEIHDSRPKEP